MGRKIRRWTRAEIDYLIANYSTKLTCEIAEALGRSYQSVTGQAFKFGLKKSKRTRGNKNWAKKDNRGKKVVYREETECLADIICFMHRRGVDVRQISSDVKCPPEQVKEILKRCMEDGSYEFYAKQENKAITGRISSLFDADIKRKYSSKRAGNKALMYLFETDEGERE